MLISHINTVVVNNLSIHDFRVEIENRHKLHKSYFKHLSLVHTIESYTYR